MMPSSARPSRPTCAICDSSNQTVRLCDSCRADPANAGWNERGMYGESTATADACTTDDRPAEDSDARGRIAALHQRKLRPLGERTRQILQLVGFYQILDYRRPEGRRRATCEWIRERRPLHLAEVAFLVGVSTRSFLDTLRRYEPLMRAALAAAEGGSEDQTAQDMYEAAIADGDDDSAAGSVVEGSSEDETAQDMYGVAIAKQDDDDLAGIALGEGLSEGETAQSMCGRAIDEPSVLMPSPAGRLK